MLQQMITIKNNKYFKFSKYISKLICFCTGLEVSSSNNATIGSEHQRPGKVLYLSSSIRFIFLKLRNDTIYSQIKYK